MPVPSRKSRDGTASTKPVGRAGFGEAARVLGGQFFALWQLVFPAITMIRIDPENTGDFS
jgi:hypothetical protein